MNNVPAKTFKDLVVWQKAHRFVLNVYAMTKNFPKEELFGLTSQLRRAAVSIPANIAEGFKKRGIADKARFYNIAQGSLEECRYYCILSIDLQLAKCENLLNDLDEISKMLERYYNAIKNDDLK